MTSLLDHIRAHKADIMFSASKHGVKDIAVFGSVARGEERPDSDIDLLIDVEDWSPGLGFVSFKLDMEKMLGRDVDVVFRQCLHRVIRNDVLDAAKNLDNL